MEQTKYLVAGAEINMDVKLVLLFISALGCSSCLADEMRPISSDYGICLKGMSSLEIVINAPVDVEFASLIHDNHVIGRFEITVLGPAYKMSADERRRWANDEVVIVAPGDGFVGIKKIHSGAGYNNAYVYFRKNPRWADVFDTNDLMHALSSCDLKATLNFSSPPEFDDESIREN